MFRHFENFNILKKTPIRIITVFFFKNCPAEIINQFDWTIFTQLFGGQFVSQPNTKYEIRSSKYKLQIRYTKYDIRYTQYEIRYTIYDIRYTNTKYDIRNTQYDIRNTKYDIRNTIYEILFSNNIYYIIYIHIFIF